MPNDTYIPVAMPALDTVLQLTYLIYAKLARNVTPDRTILDY